LVNLSGAIVALIVLLVSGSAIIGVLFPLIHRQNKKALGNAEDTPENADRWRRTQEITLKISATRTTIPMLAVPSLPSWQTFLLEHQSWKKVKPN